MLIAIFGMTIETPFKLTWNSWFFRHIEAWSYLHKSLICLLLTFHNRTWWTPSTINKAGYITVASMTWLTVTDYLGQKLPHICYVCRNHNLALSLFI